MFEHIPKGDARKFYTEPEQSLKRVQCWASNASVVELHKFCNRACRMQQIQRLVVLKLGDPHPIGGFISTPSEDSVTIESDQGRVFVENAFIPAPHIIP